ncbi:MAG: serine/threonine protein kinase [Patescibacteria group bacterium]
MEGSPPPVTEVVTEVKERLLNKRTHLQELRVVPTSENATPLSPHLIAPLTNHLGTETVHGRFILTDSTRYELSPHALEDRIYGGQGMVVEVFDTHLGKKCAFKIPHDDHYHSSRDHREQEVILEKLLREARIAASLTHRSIAKIYNVAVIKLDGVDLPGYVMEQLRPLPKRLKQNEVTTMISELADALDYAHQQGIVHQDVKPNNIMLTDDNTPVITDFGYAYRLDKEDMHNTIGGTDVYMDRMMDLELDRRASRPDTPPAKDLFKLHERIDQYSLAMTAFKLLFPNYDLKNLYEQITKNETLAAQSPFEIIQLFPKIDPALLAVFKKATSYNREERYDSCSAFADELEQTVLMTQASKGSLFTRIGRKLRKK